MLKKILYKLISYERIRKFIVKKEGGEKESLSLREYLKDNYSVVIGLYTYGSCFHPTFNTGGHVTIGKYCSFGSNVHYFGSNHPMNHAVMSAYFYNREFSGLNVKDVIREKLVVGNDVWIGHGAIVLSSCNYIGNGAVIGAGAIVVNNIPDYAIAVGAPAKVIRYRFDINTIAKLKLSEWWNLNPNELMMFYELIDKPCAWAEKIIEQNNVSSNTAHLEK